MILGGFLRIERIDPTLQDGGRIFLCPRIVPLIRSARRRRPRRPCGQNATAIFPAQPFGIEVKSQEKGPQQPFAACESGIDVRLARHANIRAAHGPEKGEQKGHLPPRCASDAESCGGRDEREAASAAQRLRLAPGAFGTSGDQQGASLPPLLPGWGPCDKGIMWHDLTPSKSPRHGRVPRPFPWAPPKWSGRHPTALPSP